MVKKENNLRTKTLGKKLCLPEALKKARKKKRHPEKILGLHKKRKKKNVPCTDILALRKMVTEKGGGRAREESMAPLSGG